MGKVYESIDGDLQAWIEAQPIFFVATAPLSAEGHVNCSPRGLDSLRVLGPKTVAWLDLTGSGAETLAHLRENGRIVLMFCAFAGPPKIVRLHGQGRAHLLGEPEFEAMKAVFPPLPGARAIIRVDIARVSDSCGYSVPLMELQGDRDTLTKWATKRGEEGLEAYRQARNRTSIDGLKAWPGGDETS